MPIYATLLKTTAEGIKALKECQSDTEEAQREIEKAGGRLINAYALLGRYDFLYIVEFPDEKSALKVLLKTVMKGRVAPESMVAIPLEGFFEAVKEA